MTAGNIQTGRKYNIHCNKCQFDTNQSILVLLVHQDVRLLLGHHRHPVDP